MHGEFAPSAPSPDGDLAATRWRRLWASLTGTIAALAVGWVLFPALYENRAQSFDVMLYTRSLWGVAHGDFFQPVAGVGTFAVHLHAGLFLLAPLVWLSDALAALIIGQAVALGVTVGLVVSAALRALDVTRLVPLWSLGLLATLATSCWVSNAFLYDVRPDLLAVPFATAAFLRLRAHRRLDLLGAMCAAAAVLCREEMGMTIAAGVVVAPGLRADLGRRSACAAGAVGLWVAYLLWGRTLFGGVEAVERLDGTVDTFLGVEPSEWPAAFLSLLPNRLWIVLGAALTLGGAAAAGGRWWLAALPGMAWVLVSLRQPLEALHFHYPLFAAPALLVASVEGLERVATWARRWPSRAWAVVAAAGCLASFAFASEWSSWPGGGRFAEERYRAAHGPSGPAIERSHALLDALVESEEGAVLPWSLIGARAGRTTVWSQMQMQQTLGRGGVLPPEIRVVALIRSDVRGWESALWEQGFRPVTPPTEPLFIARRGEAVP